MFEFFAFWLLEYLISFDTWDMLSEMKEGKIPVIVAFKNT
jgi:hypothetical protein